MNKKYSFKLVSIFVSLLDEQESSEVTSIFNLIQALHEMRDVYLFFYVYITWGKTTVFLNLCDTEKRSPF